MEMEFRVFRDVRIFIGNFSNDLNLIHWEIIRNAQIVFQ